MAFSALDYIQNLDNQIQTHHLLKNVFYLAWSEGKLTKECLTEYALDYYDHVREFPKYLSALHSHTDCEETRIHLLQNLTEEEAGSPNHPQLWRQFVRSFGVSDEIIDAHQSSPEIQHLIHTFKDICLNGTVAEGLAALYAYESQIPDVSISKIDGLKKHYGMTKAENWKYFSVHIAADKEHAAIERKLLEAYVTEENAEEVSFAVQRVLDALNGFLNSLCHKYAIAC